MHVQARPRARLRTTLSAARRWRPGLRSWVLASSALVVIGAAVPIAGSAADQLRQSSMDAATRNAESIVRSYLDPILGEGSLDLAAEVDPQVQEQLRRLVAGRELERVNVWTRDGRIMYSTEPEIRGRRFDIDQALVRAFAGTAASEFGSPEASEAGASTLPARYLEINVPIRGQSDGSPIGVFEVYMDAAPIEATVEQIRGDVFLFALAAGAILLALLWAAFNGASRLLASQNRRLTSLNLELEQLAASLSHREARFRSLVQNSSDVVVVIGADGRVTYASDALRRVLGTEPDSAAGRPFEEGVHPEEVGWVRSLLAGLAGSRGGEQTTELRMRHADGSWRWVEAIGQNLLREPAVGGVVLNFRDITDRKRLEDQLQHEAFHDPLTGLANRALFADRVTHALARSQREQVDRLAVLLVDLDEFKIVNDSLGHAAGDSLLTAVAERIRACLRRQDTAARLGGDEFGILLEEADPDLAGEVAERILAALRQPFALEARQLFVQASIGIALSGEGAESRARTADELLRDADAAMYTAKSRGKGRYEYFASQMHTSALRRLELRAQLEEGLERGDFVVEYQPVVEILDAAVVGAEALVRWRQPDGRLLPPSEFVPLAEETGLIVQLGQHVLETACREAAAWEHLFPGRELSLAVNVSSRQLQEPGFGASVAATLARSGLGPRRLVLEVTESALLDEGEATAEAIAQVKALGVRIALDDFGTGYSSLSHLRRFPIDVLKIDRSFVDGIDGGARDERTLVRSIVRLAHSLKLETVAEGVERHEQLVQLRAIGAAMGQGFYFARPMDPAAFLEHVREGISPRGARRAAG
jgi:diguanylate cyclase (GGDEF)-like protein/PAS domain S-box-containing protein